MNMSDQETTLSQLYLKDVLSQFRLYKRLAEKAIAQISDQQFFFTLGDESNSIALIMKHIGNQQRSRWTNFLISDGEKPDRHRDSEFEKEIKDTKQSILQLWESGWGCLFQALEPFKSEDLARQVLIRGESVTVVEAIDRQLTHYACHVGQIMLIAKHLAKDKWRSLSIPRGKSEEFNLAMRKKHKLG
jgi:hypothetical protein